MPLAAPSTASNSQVTNSMHAVSALQYNPLLDTTRDRVSAYRVRAGATYIGSRLARSSVGVFSSSLAVELHGFFDASQRALGAVRIAFICECATISIIVRISLSSSLKARLRRSNNRRFRRRSSSSPQLSSSDRPQIQRCAGAFMDVSTQVSHSRESTGILLTGKNS